MKSAIVFYSMDGHTKRIAEMIATIVDGDLYEVTSDKQIPAKGFSKYFWGGKAVLFNEIPKIEVKKLDLNMYDVIYVGTPIWVSTMAPPLRAWCEQNNIEDKKIALFCTHGGGKFLKYIDSMKRYYPYNTFTEVLDVHENNVMNSEEQVREWCQKMK